jgi:hypothetical protein
VNSVRSSRAYNSVTVEIKFNISEICCLYQTNISETFFVSIRPAFGDLLCFRQTVCGDFLRLRQNIYRRLTAFPWDQLSETCCVSFRLAATSLLGYSSGGFFCFRVPTATCVVSIRQRSRRFAFLPSDQSFGDLICRYLPASWTLALSGGDRRSV